jgi:hypothetical protein
MIRSSVTFATGKKAARPGAVQMKLGAYLKAGLPRPADPRNFGHASKIATNGWGMLANDQFGDCVWAGAAHEHMLMAAIAGTVLKFTDKNVLAAYSAVTGFNAKDPATDQGTDMQAAASYRRKTGIKDSKGHVHKVAAYLEVAKHSLDQISEAAYLFGAVGVGIEFPDFAMDQFNRGEPWDVVAHAPAPQDGHYIPVVGVENGNLVCVTWGRKQLMTPAFFTKYCDEAVAYINPEYLVAGKTPEGFDAAALTADLAGL